MKPSISIKYFIHQILDLKDYWIFMHHFDVMCPWPNSKVNSDKESKFLMGCIWDVCYLHISIVSMSQISFKVTIFI